MQPRPARTGCRRRNRAGDARRTIRSFALLLALPFAARPALSQAVDRATCGVAPGKNLVVLVGRKLDLRPFVPAVPEGTYLLDRAFRARYRVLHVLCGDLDSREVEFEVYDHRGTPAFAGFDTVLLFLTREDGQLVHEKYQYADVYETADGSWAGCGDPYRLEPEVHRGAIRARPMPYRRPVTFSVRGLGEEEIRRRHPAELFERQGDVVVCRAGAPLADLLAVKREGVLRARGIFR